MHVEKIRFDEIFDVAAHGGFFSFRSGGGTRYGVKLGNNVIPHPGSTYVIAFARPGDWGSVQGWRDLDSPRVALAYPGWMLWTMALADLAAYGIFFLAAGLLLAGLPGVAAVAAICIGIAAVRLRRNGAAKRALTGAGGCAG